MTKQEIFTALHGPVSKSSIVERGGDYVVRGKFGIVSPLENGGWDVWFCCPTNPAACLGARKLSALLSKLDARHRVTVLDGEAWFQTDDPAEAAEVALLVGARRSRQLSEEGRRAMADRLQKNRTSRVQAAA